MRGGRERSPALTAELRGRAQESPVAGLYARHGVVAELVYVASATIGWDRAQVAEHLGSLLDADGILLTDEPTVVRALALYGATSGLDFADAYLAAAALEIGPPVVASFDADFDRVAGIRRIAA